MSFDQRVYAWRGHFPAPTLATGSLAGLRLGVKDLFHIAGLPTGAGNPDWLASHPLPQQTSPIVFDLLQAGAELVGKTQTDELAYSLNGLNIHYGAPLNPQCPDRLPGGSSSGSAVAVAAGDIDIGLGTDTGGSIRVPASYNGLFGIRTTHGLLSREHMVPLAPLFDTVGWMTADGTLLEAVGKVLLPEDLPQWPTGPLRVGVIEPEIQGFSLWSEDHEAWLTHQMGLSVFKRLSLSADWLARASQCFRTLQGRAIWQTHGQWISERQPHFAPDIRARFDWCSQLTPAQEREAQIERLALQVEIQDWFEGVDLLLLPTTPGPAPLLGADATWMDNYRSQLMGLTAPAGLAGLPQVHLPVLSVAGAPAGVSLLGQAGFDRALLELAAHLDRAASLRIAQVML